MFFHKISGISIAQYSKHQINTILLWDNISIYCVLVFVIIVLLLIVLIYLIIIILSWTNIIYSASKSCNTWSNIFLYEDTVKVIYTFRFIINFIIISYIIYIGKMSYFVLWIVWTRQRYYISNRQLKHHIPAINLIKGKLYTMMIV